MRCFKEYKNKQKGFTLMELLVVILVIGILGGILFRVINPRGVQMKSRDAQRVADLRQLNSVLELYFNDHREYPTTLDELETGGYTNQIPQDPNGGNYIYSSTTYISDPPALAPANSNYILLAIMEMESSAEESPCADALHARMNNEGPDVISTDDEVKCYMVTSPTCVYSPD